MKDIQAYGLGADGKVDTASGATVPAGKRLIVKDPGRAAQVTGPDGAYVQLDATSAFPGTWVRRDALDLGTPSDLAAQVKADRASGWKTALQAGGKAEAAFSPVQDLSGFHGYIKDFKEYGANPAWSVSAASGLSDQTASNLGYAAGAGSTAFAFVKLASAITTLADREASGWDKGAAVIDGLSAVTSGAGGVAGIVKSATNPDGKGFDAVAGLAVFAGIFDAIKGAYTVVQKAVELAKAADDPKKAKSGQDKFHDGMAIAVASLEAAKGVVSTVKVFVDLANDGPTAALSNTIPGFGIALGAAELIVRGVDLVFAMARSSKMRDQKRANKDAFTGTTRSYSVFKKSPSSKTEATTFMDTMDARVTTARQTDPAADHESVLSAPELARYQAASDYLLTRGIQGINDKRRNRALYKISVALTKISGDIAVLGGVSAPIGAGIKAAGTVTDLGFSAARTFKQWGRNKKASMVAKGKTVAGFWTIFDEKKSTTAKEASYHRDVDKLFAMIVKAAAQQAAQPTAEPFAKVKDLISAIGISMTKVQALRDDPATLRKELVSAMKNRE